MNRLRRALLAVFALMALGLWRSADGQVFVQPGKRPNTYLHPLGPQPKPLGSIDIVQSYGITSDKSGNIYLGSLGAGRILRIDAVTRRVAVLVEGRKGPCYAGTTPATTPTMRSPIGFAFDAEGDLFVADPDDNRIRKIAAGTGVLTTVAGSGKAGFSGDGQAATAAQLWYPSSVAVTRAGDIYVADSLNQRVRKISAGTGIITTVAGGPGRGFNHTDVPGTEAMLQFPTGLALDASENLLFADVFNNRIWKLDTRSGYLTTAVGTGENCLVLTAVSGEGEPPEKTMLFHPNSVSLDPAGNIFILEQEQTARGPSRRLIRVDSAGHTVNLIAKFGDAEGDKPPTRNPNDVAVDPAGKLYVIDDTVGQNGVDTLTPPEIDARLAFYKAEVQRDGPTPPSSYPAKLIAGGAFPWPLFGFSGDGGQATAAQIAAAGIAVDAAGNVFFSEALDHRIRKVAAKTGIISTVVGTGKPGFSGDGGPGSAAQINAAITIAVDRAGNLFFSDNNRVRKVDATTGLVSTVAGNGRSEVSDDVAPRPASTACVGGQLSMALDSQEGLYFNAGYAVDRLDFKNGTVSRFAGTHEQGFAGDGGPATSAQLVGMLDWYACDPDDNLYISEGWSIRRVDARTHVITTPAGIINGKNASALVDGAPAKSVVLGGGFVVDRAGNIFICVGSDLWKVDAASGKMRLLAREFAGTGLAIDPEGDLFFAMTNQILELPADALSR